MDLPAFIYGSSHLIAVDNIRWIIEGEGRYYRTGLGQKQINFIENYLEMASVNDLVVFLAHIPWVDSTPWADDQERQQLFDVIASHPNTITFAAHTHRHYHRFIGEEDGFSGNEDHHMVSMATVCGSWWTGAPDEYGIPHSLMQDGTPTGYGFLDIDGNEWNFSFKAARRPLDFQMHISSPDEITIGQTNRTHVYANVFNALPDAKVEMKVGNTGSWQEMESAQEEDPVYVAMNERENSLEDLTWLRTGDAYAIPRHLWKSTLPANLEKGTYTIFIRAEDRWHSYESRRIIRITE